MTPTTRLLLAAAAVAAAAALFVLQPGADPLPAGADAPAAEATAAATPAAGALPSAEATPAVARTAAGAAPAASWLDHPYEVGLDVLVVDTLGLPVADHRLMLAPMHCTPNEAEHPTGPDGRVALTWRTRQRTLEVQLADPRGQLRRLTLQHGARTSLTLLGKAPGRGSALVVFGSRTTRANLDGGTIRIESLAQSDSPFGPDLRMHLGHHPAAVFGDALAQVEEDAPGPDLDLVVEDLAFAMADSQVLGELRATRRRTPAADPGPAVEAVVFGADGKPAQRLPVVLLGSGPQPLQRLATDDQGRCRFQQVAPGEVTVRAGGDAQGLAEVAVVVTTGTAPCTLHLRRGTTVQGRATGTGGTPRAGHLVEWRALDGSWADATQTGEDGTFLFANLPGKPGALWLFDREGNTSLPIASVPAVLPDTTDVALAADGNTGSVLRAQLPPAAATGKPTLLAWHADTGLALRFPRPAKGGAWASPQLPAGFYDLELRVPGAGSRALGRHWLDGTHDVDLGPVEPPHAGTIRITIPAANLPADLTQRVLEVVALRAALDVRVEPAELPLDRPIHLPAGDYALVYRHAAGDLRWHRFPVVAGEATVVAPGP